MTGHLSFVQPRVLTILGTYRCTASCEHCCFDSNPHIKQRLSLDQILRAVDEAASLGSIGLVVFSGGECFLLGDDLVTAVRHIAEKGLRVRCVSNGFWAKGIDAGRRRLLQLRDAGLNEINLSTGDYHQQYVSERTVINAARLGIELGLGTLIMVETQVERRVTARLLKDNNPEFFDWAKQHSSEGCRILESPWMPMAADQVIRQHTPLTLSADNIDSKTGCENIFHTIVATPTGGIGFCCGLSRERIAELNAAWPEDLGGALVKASSDFMKIWLAVDGPEKIIAWAASKNPAIDWQHRFAHHCQVCLAIFHQPLVRQTIKDHWPERRDDVLMRYSLMLRREDALRCEHALPELEAV